MDRYDYNTVGSPENQITDVPCERCEDVDAKLRAISCLLSRVELTYAVR
jgi:hypothetical protein